MYMEKSKDNIEFIVSTLEAMFPNAHCELDYNNLYELIIAVSLSAQTTDKRVNVVTKDLFKKYPPKCVYVSSSRILCAKNGNFENKELNSSAVAYAWYEFENGYNGETTIKWIN